jgi:LysM repeat protein
MKTQWFKNEFANRVTAAVGKFLPGKKEKYKKPSYKYHVVKKGETLSLIALKYNTTARQLRKLNGMSVKSTLRYGKKLRVLPGKKEKYKKPSYKYHVVKKGESLYSIAKRYKTTISKLRRLNGMSVKSTLRYGKKLRIL